MPKKMNITSIHTLIISTLLLISTLLIGSCQTKGGTKLRTSKSSAIDSLALVQKESFKLPGLAVGIIKDDKILYAKGFGVRSLSSQRVVTTKSIFHMASVS